MHSTTYKLQTRDKFLDYDSVVELLLHDVEYSPEDIHKRALAASGDYFETLACNLEQIAQGLPTTSPQHYQLEHIIHTLQYLQRHYKIVKK
ncbi:MAG: hypothetical protein WBP26_06190 [Candidatus Saccharimonadales bacterium]